jgi:peptidoglycan/xylan/chitin deacetylase (PgdA/CDA1 family)
MNVHDPRFHLYSSIIQRPPLAWPGGARVAFVTLISAEYYELQPPANAFIPPNVPGGFGYAPYPDVRAFSQREYGNRIGVFRIIEALRSRQMPATVATDANVARRYPAMIDEFRKLGWEIAGHGISATQVISDKMNEDRERTYIAESLDAVERAGGVRPRGWHGPEYGESLRTPALLAEMGVRYLLDWPNDEQPYVMNTPAGEIVSIPMALELDDVVSCHHRRISSSRWRQAVSEALDQLSADAKSGRARHLVLNLHPWLIGQPHRIGYLEDVLDDVRARSDVWVTTAAELVESYLNQQAK